MLQYRSPGVHLIPEHGRPEDIQIIGQWGCKIVKTLRWDPIYWKSLFDNGAQYVVLREHPISEQQKDMRQYPEETGKRHARELHDKFVETVRRGEQAKIKLPSIDHFIFEGINEPWMDAGPRGEMAYDEWLKKTIELTDPIDRYMVSFAKTCVFELYMPCALFLFGVGWPPNVKDGGQPSWHWFARTLDFISSEDFRGKIYVMPHAYWPFEGPSWNGEWHAYRWKSFPRAWKGKEIKTWIWLGEIGIDQLVKVANLDYSERGWKKRYNDDPMVYAKQLLEFWLECQKDDRFIGFALFTSDGDFQHWYSFDVLRVYKYILQLDWKSVDSTEPPAQPPSPPLSSGVVYPLKNPVVTQLFGERYNYYFPKFGVPGHNGIDMVPSNSVDTQVMSIADGVVEWVDVSTGYGNYVRVWHEQLGVHSFYAHLDKQSVRGGQKVNAGTVIGVMGNTGNSTGPHLHLEIRAGTRYDYKVVVDNHKKGQFSPSAFFHLNS